MINSKSDNIPEDIEMISQEADEENFEKTVGKAKDIDTALRKYDYGDGERFEKSALSADMMDLWDDVMDIIDKRQCPSYDKECQYCPFKSSCPVKQGKLGGLNAL